ncbi:MAG: alkaline phosphatase D family protein [Caldilineaceae bacterium]
MINQTELYSNGLATSFAFNPLQAERYGVMGGDGRMDGAPKLYRYRLFGLDAALFILDARLFRDLPLARPDRNDPADVARFRAETFRPERTMLGQAQMADLQRDLLTQAHVTWKFIAIPEPIQHRGLMSAQDRFEGYAAERGAAALHRRGGTQQRSLRLG